jgi:small subunit ribosomal protein S2
MEVTAVGAELKPGERKVISDGTEGPVVEIIKRSAAEEMQVEETPEQTDNVEISEPAPVPEVETTGEKDGSN